METFDAPARDISCTRRQRTNTPLQALVLMNDPQWVEAARVLAERALHEGGATTDSRLDFLGRVLLGQPLKPALRQPIARSLPTFLQAYKGDPKAAADLLRIGDKPCDAALDSGELAGWTLVASEMLNLDATLNN
jgi:hypothetical protein